METILKGWLEWCGYWHQTGMGLRAAYSTAHSHREQCFQGWGCKACIIQPVGKQHYFGG